MDFKQICISGTDGKGGLNRWEGRTAFMYLDSRRVNGAPAPLVTIGVGCAVQLAEAKTLPFVTAATSDQIEADFATLQKAPFGYAAAYYARFTTCRLPNDAIDALVMKRFASFIAALQVLFKTYDTWPDTAKAAALDLMYGTGEAGFKQYHMLLAAGNENPPSFLKMASECASDASNPAYKARNDARGQLFLSAVPVPVS
jgi:hypothetical protein